MTKNSRHMLQIKVENEGYLRSIFDNALYGIATTVGTDFRFVSVNDAFCRLIEYDRNELVDVRTVDAITLPDGHPRNKQLLDSMVNNEIQRFKIEKQYLAKSGRCIDVIVYVQGFYDNDGKYIGSTGSIMDITERNKMVRELKISESKYRGLVENSMVGVFSSTLNGRFVFVNDALARMYDFDSPKQMITQKTFVRWSDLKQRERMLTMLQKDGSVTNFETKTITDTGRHIHVLISATLIGDNIHGMLMEVTEIYQAREALQISESNLVRAQEVAHAGSWNLDFFKDDLDWTDETYKIYGISKRTPTMTYETFLELVHPKDREYVDKQWSAAIEGKPYNVEHRILVGDEVKWVRNKAEVIFDDNGDPISAIGTTLDITRRKLAEIDLQKLAGRLLTVEEGDMRRVLRELHDDLAQRLALLVIEAGMAKNEGCTDEAATILQNLQDNLISISEDVHRISRQLHPSIIEDLGLEDALRSEINNFSRLEEIPVKFEYGLGPANLSLDLSVCLFRVTQESLRNTQKHAHAKNVTIQLVKEKSSLLLTIGDDGRGFAPDNVRNLPGLGLRSMRERMRLINGSISYSSRPGQGTIVEARVDMPS